MKRVLIVCDLFPPAFGPRMGYLCKYLEPLGWEPVVVTERVPSGGFEMLSHTCEVYAVDCYPAKRAWLRKWKWIAVQLVSLFFDYKGWKLKRVARRVMAAGKFDLVLCSTYRTFPLRAAASLAREGGIPLVADLRDIIEQYAGSEFIAHRIPEIPLLKPLLVSIFRKQNLRERNAVLRAAEAVTTVSPWHVDILSQFNANMHLIYNGFDPEIFFPQPQKTAQFVITYTGRLLSLAMRDPSLLFAGLRRLADEGLLSPENCRVDWYVDDGSWRLIAAEAEKWGVSLFMCQRGYVPAADIPRILNQSSLLLLLTNKSAGKGPKGVMTTKLFESLAVRKPILCVRNDEGVLQETLRKTGAGCAASTVEEVCAFLRTNFQVWQQNGYTEALVRDEAIAPFSRKEQAAQFVRLFESLKK